MASREDPGTATSLRTCGDPRPRRPLSPWSGFAHDLGNLLQTATSAINIIDRGTTLRPNQVGMAIAGAKASLSHASDLLRRIIVSVPVTVRLSEVANVEVCLAEIATVLGSALQSGIKLEMVLDAQLPHVACDSIDLRNAILNLVFNARNAILDEGRIAVHAHSVRGEAGEAELEISVADDGVGMSAATIERAFDPYFTTKSEDLGGIGLTAVEQFVQDSRGRIWIESELGVGTVVRMRLPMISPDCAEDGGFAL